MEKDQKDTIKVLDKAIAVLDVLKGTNSPLGVNEISRLCNINVTTTFRILKTLKNNGWVFQNEKDKYMLGYNNIFVSEKNNFYLTLKEMAYYTMNRLSNIESQAMNLCVREYNKIIIYQQSRTDKLVDYVPPQGSTLPIYASASGKILLSELSENIVHEIFKTIEFIHLTENTITDKSQFMEELKKVKQQGYALDLHESDNVGSCIAVPMRNEENEIIAALTFSGFIGGISNEDRAYYFNLLKNASKEIMDRLNKMQ